MIGNMAVRITADRPNFPLGTLFVRAGSAANIALVGVPVRPGVNVTALALRVENVDGATADYAARAIGGVWVVDVPAAHFATVGSVVGGVSVWATGTGADGETSRTWCVGVGDLEVLTADADAPAPAPGQTFWPLRMFDAAPASPTKYNAYIDGSALKIWNGTAWVTISGGGETVDDTVTRTSANPVKSSGIWGAIWGALTALPTGFTAIYDWVVAQLAKCLPLAGGTVTGELAIGPNPNFSARFEIDAGGATSLLLRDSIGNKLYISGVKLFYQQYDWELGVELYFPSRDGTLALAAPNPTAGNLAALDANGNPTDSGTKPSDFASAADLDNLIPKYPMVAVTPYGGTATVTPYTVATYTAGDSAASFEVAVGTGTSGVVRDCELVIDCTATGAVAPTVTWPSNFHPRTDGDDLACEAGVRNVYYISEYATGEFVVGGWQETTGGNA